MGLNNEITFANEVVPDFGVRWVDAGAVVAKMKEEGADEEELREYLEVVEDLEAKQQEDLTRYGWRLDSWERVMANWGKKSLHVVLGGNRATKTHFMARLVVDLAQKVEEAEIYCFHTSERRSIDDQQRFVWEALPAKYREIGRVRGKNYNLQYSQANGFVGSKLILPPREGSEEKRGSAIYFYNYNQYKQDDRMSEGWKAHLIWGDEEMPVDLYATLLSRLTDYRGRMVLTFTTVAGWTPLIARILGRVRTVEERWAQYVQMRLPVMQESFSQWDCNVYYFWTEDNPFVPVEDLVKKMRGRPLGERLARLYGVPQKSAMTVFPKFGDWNVVPHMKLPWLREGGQGAEYPCTRYMVVDGAGARNWFMLWVAVDAAEVWWVYREWPDVAGVGEWILPGPKPGGAKGPGQRSLGLGTQEYVEVVRKLEGGEEIFERYIDPRFAGTEKQLKEGTTTPAEELSELGMDVLPAPGVQEDAGLQVLGGMLAWDESRPMDVTNSPKMFVSDRCQNFIACMKEYTGTQGKDEASKDPVDCARYLAVAKIEYVEAGAGVVQATSGGY